LIFKKLERWFISIPIPQIKLDFDLILLIETCDSSLSNHVHAQHHYNDWFQFWFLKINCDFGIGLDLEDYFIN